MPVLMSFLFEGNELGSSLAALSSEGGRLVDICDEARAPVLFSCRSASCGVCRVEVVEGVELLEPPGPNEILVLETFKAPAGQRLACQAVVRHASGLVRIRWVNEA